MNVHSVCSELGFPKAYILPPNEFPYYKRRQNDGALDSEGMHLSSDPEQDFPWSNAILLVLYPYHPYPADALLSGYYPASNTSFFLGNNLIRILSDQGIRTERIYVPVRELAVRNGVGVPCKSGLTAFAEYGTRIIAHTFAIRLSEPFSYDHENPENLPVCKQECKICIRACPAEAINENGLAYQRCVRAYMKKNAMPKWAMDSVRYLLGCEICQLVCPINKDIAVNQNVPPEFQLESILSGNIKPALEIVGKNQKSGGKLIAHAIILAAHQERRDLTDLIKQYLNDPREAVSCAAKYAWDILQEA